MHSVELKMSVCVDRVSGSCTWRLYGSAPDALHSSKSTRCSTFIIVRCEGRKEVRKGVGKIGGRHAGWNEVNKEEKKEGNEGRHSM